MLEDRQRPAGAFTRGRVHLNGVLEDRILKGCSEVQKHIILLANANAGEPVRGRTKLQKMMFMVSDLLEAVGEYGFKADNYGPYSDTVGEEARYLADVGVLHEGDEISLTSMGRRLAERLAESEDGGTVAAISRYKEMLNDLTTKEVLAYVYSAYPTMTVRSTAYRDIERDMEKHVMSMLKKEKITVGRASELLGRNVLYVMRQASKMGIPVLG